MDYTKNYLLDKKIVIYQPVEGYRASTDAVLLSSLPVIGKGESVLDAGSGTGAISLCLAKRFGHLNIKIDGFEFQKDLVGLSNMSADENGFGEFLHYIERDIHQKSKVVEPYSHVITNPPYSDHDMPSPNASKALAHNHKELSLKEWLDFCVRHIKPKGFLYMINRAEAVNEAIIALGDKVGNMKIIPLYSKEGQDAKRIMIIAQKDSKAPSRILQGFVVHDSGGNYTLRANDILRKGCGFF